jgi:pilus assembly protein CpaC
MMPPISTHGRSCRPILTLALLVIAAAGLVTAVTGQDLLPPPPSTVQPPGVQLPPVPEIKPRPIKGAESVANFVKGLSTTDSVFEVFVGQGRIMTVTEDLVMVKKKDGKELKDDVLIAVGDPSIVEFVVVNNRQIRVVGLRMGTTDFSITTADNRTYTFEVRVVADLNVLRGQLQTLFPSAKELKVSQVRDHIVVEGEAKDVDQRNQILVTIRSYLDSIKASQFTATRKGGSQPPPTETYLINLLRVNPAAELKSERKAQREEDKNEMEELEGQLRRLFPDAKVSLTKINYDIAVTGQARDQIQVGQILQAVEAYLVNYRLNFLINKTAEAAEALKGRRQEESIKHFNPLRLGEKEKSPDEAAATTRNANTNVNSFGGAQSPLQTLNQSPQGKVINMLRIPGPQQVLLKVRIAELNRTAFRQIGADFLVANGGSLVGTKIAGNAGGANVSATGAGLVGLADIFAGGPATVFGVFENSDFSVFVNALRRNELLKILAEPNLVAMNGHKADFLAGGEFPVPVPQSGSGGGAATITIEFKPFGVKLAFKPDVLDNGVVRLSVDPEVSSIDFAIGTSINGTVVPGLNTRKAHTVVEMKEGQTLAMAGLLAVTLEGTTNRIPGVGDLPILGPFFSNTTSKRQEKELIVLVTPYLVDAMKCDQVPPSPGDEVNAPTDLEFFLGNRIEGRTGRDWRATTGNFASAPALLPSFLRLHDQYIRGPHGFSD